MMELIRNGGFMMYPMLATAAGVAGMSIWSWMSLVKSANGSDAVVETRIDSVLFWGAYGVVLGVLGTLIGFAQIAQAVQASGVDTLSPQLLWGGIKVALITVIFGFLIFSIAMVCWFMLRVRYRRSVATV